MQCGCGASKSSFWPLEPSGAGHPGFTSVIVMSDFTVSFIAVVSELVVLSLSASCVTVAGVSGCLSSGCRSVLCVTVGIFSVTVGISSFISRLTILALALFKSVIARSSIAAGLTVPRCSIAIALTVGVANRFHYRSPAHDKPQKDCRRRDDYHPSSADSLFGSCLIRCYAQAAILPLSFSFRRAHGRC